MQHAHSYTGLLDFYRLQVAICVWVCARVCVAAGGGDLDGILQYERDVCSPAASLYTLGGTSKAYTQLQTFCRDSSSLLNQINSFRG